VTVIALTIGARTTLDQLVYSWTYTYNFFHASSAFEYSAFLTHTWSLAVEEQFYLVFPFLALMLARRSFFAALLLMLLVGPLFRLMMGDLAQSYPGAFSQPALAVYTVGITHVDAFAIGALLNWLPAHRRAEVGRPRWLLLAAAGSIGFAYLVTRDPRAAWYPAFPELAAYMHVWAYSLLNVVFAIMVCGAEQRAETYFGPLQRLMARLGEWSYGIYLFHHPLIPIVGLGLGAVGMTLDSGPWLVVRGVVALVLTVSLARLSFEHFEKRFLRLKDRITPGERVAYRV
jgi:peptidoglycan/LPS O-acetylase OafA/YrhL